LQCWIIAHRYIASLSRCRERLILRQIGWWRKRGEPSKVLADREAGVYRFVPCGAPRFDCHDEEEAMNQRQKRSDEEMAKAVTRGVNIMEVRGWSVAQRYMEHKHVPARVIARVLAQPELRRKPSPEHSESEAITPLAPPPRIL
jgi:hypothetical protein